MFYCVLFVGWLLVMGLFGVVFVCFVLAVLVFGVKGVWCGLFGNSGLLFDLLYGFMGVGLLWIVACCL